MNDKQKIIKLYIKNLEELNNHNKHYYIKDDPKIPDFE